jgi:hypothetical protein
LHVLFAMLEYKSDADQVFSIPSDSMEWLCDPMRIPFFIGIRVAQALLSPFFYMVAAVLAKKLLIGKFIGKFKQGPRDTSSQWQLFAPPLVSHSVLAPKVSGRRGYRGASLRAC